MNAPPTILARARHALAEFFRLEAAGGIVLIGAALLALLCANSPLRDAYDGFRHLPLGSKPIEWWINDGLMAVFFLLVALEIKREALSGQLSSREQLLLPMACAAGGVMVPALLFTALNRGDADAMRGWAIPTATDIAFALGVLALLGSRVPLGMKLLLSTIAVVDDLIAILIIALFYTQGLWWPGLAGAAAVVASMWLLKRGKVKALAPYLLLGLVLWLCVLNSGVHATLAGVVTGLMIPHIDTRNEVDDEIEHSPLETLEHALHPWVAYAILPLFAFANAGLALGGLAFSDLVSPLPAGIALGLVVGKPIGIVGVALLMRATGFARFPDGMDLRAMIGLGILCGIGFTMSLFIGSLAFSQAPLAYTESVVGVLMASLVAAGIGMLWLHMVLPRTATR
ncbi:MAG: Na+/H+ antiporter NhaA [Lysobacteraceae bacterium]|nr:MAG: Na+/H+ antiporter NhaA [Xanthomonadaceae bacterium]